MHGIGNASDVVRSITIQMVKHIKMAWFVGIFVIIVLIIIIIIIIIIVVVVVVVVVVIISPFIRITTAT